MGKERIEMIVHACSDGFIIELDESEFNSFMEYAIMSAYDKGWQKGMKHADLDDDDSEDE